MNRARFNDARFNGEPIYGIYPAAAGNDRIAVAQPPSSAGANYPFSSPTSLSALVADFYLSYEDDGCDFAFPPRLVYLYGFGQIRAAQPDGTPAPTHVYDLVVADANGFPVFDSTQASVIHQTYWGTSKVVVEWIWGDQVARIVYFTNQVGNFANQIAPDAALDARTCVRLVRRVRSIIIGEQSFRGPIDIIAGYNLALAGAVAANTDGGRYVTTINLDGVPGARAGVLPGCQETTPELRTINEIGPDSSGNFLVQADQCFRLQSPLLVSGGGPLRQAIYGGRGLTSEAQAAIVLYDDCAACCPCDYYVRTYAGESRLWNTFAAIAAQAEAVRDAYVANSTRWTDQLQCRLANTLQLIAAPYPNCKSFLGAAYCNLSQCCLANAEIRFTILQYSSGNPVAPSAAANVSAATIKRPSTASEASYAPQPYAAAGNALVYSFLLDTINPRQTAVAKMLLCAPCEDGDAISITATVHASASLTPPGATTACALTPLTPSSDLADAWVAAGTSSNPMIAITTQTITMNSAQPTYPCECS